MPKPRCMIFSEKRRSFLFEMISTLLVLMSIRKFAKISKSCISVSWAVWPELSDPERASSRVSFAHTEHDLGPSVAKCSEIRDTWDVVNYFSLTGEGWHLWVAGTRGGMSTVLFAELLGWAASIAKEMLVPSKLVPPSRQHKQRNNIITEVVYWVCCCSLQG